MNNLEDIKKESKTHPGCRLEASFAKVMKTRAEIHVNFKDHNAIYQLLRREQGSRINLNYELKTLIFGGMKAHNQMVERMQEWHPKIEEELNPVMSDRPHRNGNFVVKHNLHIFPVEYKSDLVHPGAQKGDIIDSYEYSIVKKFKAISSNGMDSPDIVFQLEFLPITSVYHLKKMPVRKLVVNLLAVCGGVFSMMGIVNWFLGAGAKLLV